MSDTTSNENPSSSDAGTDDARVRDYSHILRSEGMVSDVDLGIDVAKNYSKYVVGDEDVAVKSTVQDAKSHMTFMRGSRARTAGSLNQTTDREIMMNIVDSVREEVNGPVHLTAALSAEAMIGGAYVHTIKGPYLRLAAWVDFMVWGGWAEVDAIRTELSIMMIRSHVGYAHAALLRATVTSLLVDDFQTRTENFGIFGSNGATHLETGTPGSGVDNSA